MEKVSIVVPVYNSCKTIGRCLESILEQTYSNLEIVIVNDGSTDNSLEICESYATKDSRVLLLSQENAGPSSARNFGIRNSSGTYMQFVDSDDVIKPNMTEELVKGANENSQLVICRYDKRLDGTTTSEHLMGGSGISNRFLIGEFANQLHYFMNQDLLNSLCNKLYITQVIMNNGLEFNPSIFMGEDLVFNLDYLNSVHQISFIDKALYVYDISGTDSLTRRKQPVGMLQNQEYLFTRVLDFLTQHNAMNCMNKSVLAEKQINIALACIENCFQQPVLSTFQKSECVRNVQSSIIVQWIKENISFKAQPFSHRLRLSLLLLSSVFVLRIVFYVKKQLRVLNVCVKR